MKEDSPHVEQKALPPACITGSVKNGLMKDYWGRQYEASSTYQWLPTYFDVDDKGSFSIADYINNLVPRSEHTILYTSLAQLFSLALPLLESVLSYGRAVRPRIRDSDDESIAYHHDSRIEPIKEQSYSLKGQRLQVIIKIVDYELAPGESYEGVWHVEGMSHEEIVATVIYFIHRDADIKGGDILFKRAFHKDEAEHIFSQIPQSRPRALDNLINEGLLPLGKVQTLPKRLLVFPNSHVHKVTKMQNESQESYDTAQVQKRRKMQYESQETNDTTQVQKRRIVVFFLVNPEKRIISTRDVPPQQLEAGGSMSREEAVAHRLELMKERKFNKQDWNIREIELCEH